ncbi:MAG: sulfatase-like hydrolase/transferase [Akkermansiaceae bacterium]|nr:sulfatase-like hydrolase/transferase [Akkermansiaceae bacterium]
MRAFLFLLAFVAPLLAAPPNIILVMSDDQGYGDAGYTGHPTLKTPHLDAMARAGVEFRHFHAGAPVCSPTRASVLTGRHPFRGNVPNHGHYLRPEETTLAEILRGAGYVTGHFGKWHVGSVQKESPCSPGGQGFDHWLTGLNFFDRDPYLSREGDYVHLDGQGSVLTMDAALDFLREHKNSGKPMFAVVWFPAPHLPHVETPEGNSGADAPAGPLRGYHREIKLVDEQLGRLRAALREMNIERDTILWFCSDNGGLDPKTSGGRAKKGSIYQGGLRVPSLLEWPGRIEPRVSDVASSTSDMLPTLLDLAGVRHESPVPLDGQTLVPAIRGESSTHRPIGFWFGHTDGEATHSDAIIRSLMKARDGGKPNPHPERLRKNTADFPDRHVQGLKGHAAWLDWPWKLHRIQNKKDGKVRIELYQLDADPRESDNLAASEPDRVRTMRAALEAWQDGVLRSWEGRDHRDP